MAKILSFLALACLALTVRAAGPFAVRSTDAAFDDVLSALRLAIENRGMTLTHELHLGEMWARTGPAVGAAGPLFLKARSVQFCSAPLSRRMIAEDPRRIVNCPFTLSVYVLPDEPGRTYIVHRRVVADPGADTPAMRAVEAMLEAVAAEAAEGF